MLTFKELTYVVTIAEEGGFSNAAKKLYVSQPSLSQYVKKIEQDLGFCLFERQGNNIKLTSLGREYITFANEVLQRRDTFLHTVSDYTELRKGSLTIGASAFRSVFYFPLLLPGFRAQYPGISIKLFEKPAPVLEEAVAQGTIDLAISNLPIYEPGLHTIPLLDERVLLALPPGHPLCAKLVREEGRKYPVIDLKLAADEPFIMMPTTFRLRMVSERICANAGFTPKITLVTANHATAQHLVAQGFGLNLSPETIILNRRDTPSPVYTTFSTGDYIWPIAVLCPANGFISDAARAFIAHARAVLNNTAQLPGTI